MTNKTMEKLKKKFDKKFEVYEYPDETEEKIIRNMDILYADIIWGWIEKAITQSENRILRKWKKAIEKCHSQLDYDGFLQDYIDYYKMQEEYLKAKGGSK